MRANGFPDFRIWPAGPRSELSAILYIEPLDASNARALGYDMLAENVRRRAMDAAREKGEPALSGPVTLVQDSGRQSDHTAVLMFVPVYRSAAPVDTPEERRIARLARIRVTDAEAKALEKELSGILDWVKQLDEVDTAGAEPMTRVTPMTLKQRTDAVTDGGMAEAIVENAPVRDDSFFLVPKVVE